MTGRRVIFFIVGLAIPAALISVVVATAGSSDKLKGCYEGSKSHIGEGGKTTAAPRRSAEEFVNQNPESVYGMKSSDNGVQQSQSSGRSEFAKVDKDGFLLTKIVLKRFGDDWAIVEKLNRVPCKQAPPIAPEGPAQDPTADNP